MHTAPGITDFLVRKTSTLMEYLRLFLLPWQLTTAQLFFYLVILKCFNSVDLFYPVLTCISMETGRCCRARWRIAAAAHNLCVLIGQIACQSSSLQTAN